MGRIPLKLNDPVPFIQLLWQYSSATITTITAITAIEKILKHFGIIPTRFFIIQYRLTISFESPNKHRAKLNA